MQRRLAIFPKFFNRNKTRRARGEVMAGGSGSPSISLGQYNEFESLRGLYDEIDSVMPFVLPVAFPAAWHKDTSPERARLDLQLRHLLYRTIVRALHLLTNAPADQLELQVTSVPGSRAIVWYISCAIDVSVRQLYQVYLFACHALARGAAALLEALAPGQGLNWFDAIDVARFLDEGYVAPWPVGTINKVFAEGHGGLMFVGDYVTTVVQPAESWLQSSQDEAMPRINTIHWTCTFLETFGRVTEPLSDKNLALFRERYHLRLGSHGDWFNDFIHLTSPNFCAALAAEFECSLRFKAAKAFRLDLDRVLVTGLNHGGSRDFMVLAANGLWLWTLQDHPDLEIKGHYGADLLKSLKKLQDGIPLGTPSTTGFQLVAGTEGLLKEVRALAHRPYPHCADERVNCDLSSSGLVSYKLFRRACSLRDRPALELGANDICANKRAKHA